MAQLAIAELTAAGTALMRAGCWDAARQLLQAGKTDDPDEKLQLILAEAEAAVDQDFWQGTAHSSATLSALQDAIAQAPDATAQWDLEMLQLRKTTPPRCSAPIANRLTPMPLYSEPNGSAIRHRMTVEPARWPSMQG